LLNSPLEILHLLILRAHRKALPLLKKREGGRFSVVNAWQPSQILLSPPFSKEEVPHDERAANDLVDCQQPPSGLGEVLRVSILRAQCKALPSLKKRDGGRFSVVTAWQPSQILLSPPFSKEEAPDGERAGNDLAEFQHTAKELPSPHL
jgi:hypothetical protein